MCIRDSLYSVSRPDSCGRPMVDLSKDSEAKVEITSLPPTQLVLERVITKVFYHYAIPLDISDPIRATFRSKLWRMGSSLSKLGGPRRTQQVGKWREPGSIWSLDVNSKEVCKQLLKRKHDVEAQLRSEVTKRRKIEESVHTLKEEVKTLQEAQSNSSKKIARLRAGKSENSSTRGSSSKPWQFYSRQQTSNIKKRLSSEVRSALSTCSNVHFQPISVENR